MTHIIQPQAVEDNIKRQQSIVQSLQLQSKQLQPYLNPMGANDISAQQATVTQAWDDLSCKAKDRSQDVEVTLQERKSFWDRWDKFEKWLQQQKKKLDSFSEIYSDEVADTSRKLQSLRHESAVKEVEFDQIAGDVEELCKQCSVEDHEMLEQRFHNLQTTFRDTANLTGYRQELCEEWHKFSTARKDASAQLHRSQQDMESQSLSQEDISQIQSLLSDSQQVIADWEAEKSRLDDLSTKAQMMIKDRSSQRNIYFQSEIQTMLTSVQRATTLLQQKQGKLDEVSRLWADFEDQRRSLQEVMNEIQKRTDQCALAELSADGTKDLVNRLKSIESEMGSHNPQYKEFRELGRQLISSDATRGQEVQGIMGTTETEWESTLALISERSHHADSVATLWQQYNTSRTNVSKVLSHVQPTIQDELVFSSQPEVRQTLESYKVRNPVFIIQLKFVIGSVYILSISPANQSLSALQSTLCMLLTMREPPSKRITMAKVGRKAFN